MSDVNLLLPPKWTFLYDVWKKDAKLYAQGLKDARQAIRDGMTLDEVEDIITICLEGER